MTKTTINLIVLSLVSMLAVACGDPGGADLEDDVAFDAAGPFDPAAAFDPEVAFDPENDDQGEVTPGPNSDSGVFDGEVFVEAPVGFDRLVETDPDVLRTQERLALIAGETAGFAEPGVYEAAIDLKVHLTSLLPGVASRVDTCEGGLVLDVSGSTATAAGRCIVFNGILEYALIVDLVDAEHVEGEISFIIDGVSNTVALRGFFDGDMLSLEFDSVTLAAPNVRAVWIGNVLADLP